MHSKKNSGQPFHLQGSYLCPVCRHGHLSSLALMDAFACDFCRHIFSVNLEQQLLQIADSQIPLTWRWNGRTWQGVHSDGVRWRWEYWLAAALFIGLPTTIVGVGAYIFPPATGSPLFWLPVIWTGLTFSAHLICVLWLVIEYYQFPILLLIREWRQRFLALGINTSD